MAKIGKSNPKFVVSFDADDVHLMLKFVYRFLIAIVILAGITEVVLRVKYGFCNSPLYVSDPDFEYIYAPNQDVKRFGQVLRTNSFSMRNDEIQPTDSLVILLIGDSVVNGGSLTDQDSIASTLLEKRFLKSFNKRVRVLNISAGSWGPDNIAAYLKKYGTFKAKLICLVTSSHDAFDIMSPQSPVGVDPGWPNKQYKVALYELWDRYRWIFFYYLDTLFLSPEPQKKEDKIAIVKPDVTDSAHVATDAKAVEDTVEAQRLNNAGIRKPGLIFNPGYEQIYEIAKAGNIPMFIYLHPEISEIDLGHFNDQGQQIIAFAKEKDIRLINEFQFGVSKTNYRKMDVVHFNSRGQEFLANNLYPLFLEYLNLHQ
ncbi:hypothetical protein LZD49_00950 [Dyadobacter sp. CY261]|uniref:hypothetical protein n=1 Tax=Dyadobacter sp. CY261 TaxID=2907203 RepID=UPI001F3E31BC|nr:hypothetical protein [Dyadobacter sp. CY261]MCF0069016.1 hypothetical protein [Dyadobacter sp. CY261]